MQIPFISRSEHDRIVRELKLQINHAQTDANFERQRNRALWNELFAFLQGKYSDACMMGQSFASWHDEKQGEFWNALTARVAEYSGDPDFQWAGMVRFMSPESKALLCRMAEFAKEEGN